MASVSSGAWLMLSVVVLGCGGGGPHPPRPAPQAPGRPNEPLAVTSAKPIASERITPASAPSAAQPAPQEPKELDRFEQVPGLVWLYQTDGPQDLDERCGDYEVRTRLTGDQTRVEILNSSGKIVRSFKPRQGLERYAPAWCFDVTGDGKPELAVTKTTGGAHCCHEHTLLSLGARAETLVVYAAGNGSRDLLTPVDANGDGKWELVDTNDILASEGSEAYAFTRFFPVIFRWEKGKYVRSTRQFPDYLKAERERAMTELRACAPDCWAGGEGEYVLGLSLMIGDWDTFKQAEGCPAPAQKHLEALSKRIANSLR